MCVPKDQKVRCSPRLFVSPVAGSFQSTPTCTSCRTIAANCLCCLHICRGTANLLLESGPRVRKFREAQSQGA